MAPVEYRKLRGAPPGGDFFSDFSAPAQLAPLSRRALATLGQLRLRSKIAEKVV